MRRFAFRTGYAGLLHSPLHIGHVEVEGLRINLPPKSQRKDVSRPNNGHHLPSDVSIFVDQMECTDTVLTLGTDKAGKVPLRFVIQSLSLRSIRKGKPMTLPLC